MATLLITMLVFPLMKGRIGENLFFKLVGLILVINAGLFLIVAGYTQQQVAPMVGLLGIVAGYLLGRDERRGNRAEVERSPSRPGGGNPSPQVRPVQGP